MSSAAWLSEWEVKRIRMLAGQGLRASEIASEIGRKYHVVRREMKGQRTCRRRRSGAVANIDLAQDSLAQESIHHRRCECEEDEAMMPADVQKYLIDALVPAHFSKPRVAAEQFFQDITSDLCAEGFTVETLQRAASILRKDRNGPFPKIPLVMQACKRAMIELREEAQATAGGGAAPEPAPLDEGTDSARSGPGESRSGLIESGARPFVGDEESAKAEPVPEGRAA